MGLVFIAALSLIFMGCGKSAPIVETSPGIDISSNTNLSSSDPQVVLKELNMHFQTMQMDIDQPAPENVDELVKRGVLKELPKPPAGRKYVFDPKENVIVLQ